MNRHSTVRAAFSIWTHRYHRVRWSIVWLFQNKQMLIKARQYRLREIAMVTELQNIIKLETLASLSKSKDQEEFEILNNDPQIPFKVAKIPPPKISKNN